AVLFSRRSTNDSAGYRTPGHPWTPLGFIIPMTGMLALLALGDPVRSLTGAVIVGLGLPFYFLLLRRPTTAQSVEGTRTRRGYARFHFPKPTTSSRTPSLPSDTSTRANTRNRCMRLIQLVPARRTWPALWPRIV